MNKKNIKKLYEKLGYSFKNIKNLEQSLTHPSYTQGDEKILTYQRLEFLGDSVLGLIIAEYLFKKFPKYKEGELSIVKNRLVCTKSLNNLGEKIGIPNMIIFGEGDISKTGPKNSSIIEDCVEALIGAIYLETDLLTTKEIVINLFERYLNSEINSSPNFNDSYSFVAKLQEYTQSKFKLIPNYKMIDKKGKPHKPKFIMEVSILNYKKLGEGGSKKYAMENCAETMLKFLKEQDI